MERGMHVLGAVIEPSTRKYKKYVAILPNGKRVHFGDNRYEDFTMHRDLERRKRFRDRFRSLYEKHKNNKESPIFWSWNVLW